ncbi:MAG: MFS transporter [Sphingomonadales bacterium]|nr:MAG: MFS transporter [Sphingomonadales bacterium]
MCAGFGIISLANGDLWQWWLLWFALAFAAAGLKPVVWSLSVASTFEKGRGFALAVALSGSGLGLTVVPLLSTWLIDNYGWRATPPLLGLIVGAVVIPILYFGLHSGSDTASRMRRDTGARARPASSGVDARQALLSGRFLKLAVASFLATVTGVGLGTNYIPVLSDLGMSRSEAAAMAGLAGIASIIGRLATGVLLDRYRANLVGGICVLLPLVSCFLLLSEPVSIPAAMIAVFLFGCALGAEIDIIAYLTAEQFGTARYGTIFGVVAGLWSLATAIGPIAISYIYDVTGSYDLALWLIIPAILVTSVCLFSLGKPLHAGGAQADAEPVVSR